MGAGVHEAEKAPTLLLPTLPATAPTHMRMRAHAHTDTYTHTDFSPPPPPPATPPAHNTYACTYARTHACMLTHTHTHTHTRTHARTHTHTLLPPCPPPLLPCRLAFLGPLQAYRLASPGVLSAPLGVATIACMHAVGVEVLMAWNKEITSVALQTYHTVGARLRLSACLLLPLSRYKHAPWRVFVVLWFSRIGS